MNLFKKFPDAYAIYDVGKWYGVCVQESFYYVDKQSLEIEKALPRYDAEVLEIIEKAIPISYADDEDLE